MKGFIQNPPRLGNQYCDDPPFRSLLGDLLPHDVLCACEDELTAMGALSGGELYRMQLDERDSEPRLIQWDAWGERADRIQVTPLWAYARRLAGRFGLVAAGYEPDYGEYARVRQFALIYLFSAASDLYSCPLAMTDGAARVLQGCENGALRDEILPHLITREADEFWTCGQWMTELTGGSDVGASETVAWQDGQGVWRLRGRKWFASAVDSNVALALARPAGNPPGGKGLALFCVALRDGQDRPNHMELLRLKDKLGTRKVPTAELCLWDTPARAVGPLHHGVRQIAPMLNITRLWNAVTALSYMRRGIALAQDYAHRRRAFGRRLSEQPLHRETLQDMAAELAGGLQLVFFVIHRLGRRECGVDGPEGDGLLRLLTPIAKLLTGRQAVAVVGEAIEAFGGMGYVEDTGLPALLRDTHVLTIWEGTTNVLALEAVRGMASADGLAALRSEVQRCVSEVGTGPLQPAAQAALSAVQHAQRWWRSADDNSVQRGARRLCLTLGRAIALALLCRQAQRDGVQASRCAAMRFLRSGVDYIVDEAPS